LRRIQRVETRRQQQLEQDTLLARAEAERLQKQYDFEQEQEVRRLQQIETQLEADALVAKAEAERVQLEHDAEQAAVLARLQEEEAAEQTKVRQIETDSLLG
jgi:hypothetical protein